MQGDILLILFFGKFHNFLLEVFTHNKPYKAKNEADFEWSASTFTDL